MGGKAMELVNVLEGVEEECGDANSISVFACDVV